MAGYVQLVDALHTLKISRTDVRAIVDIVSPYLGPASEWLDIERPGPALARAVPDDEDTD